MARVSSQGASLGSCPSHVVYATKYASTSATSAGSLNSISLIVCCFVTRYCRTFSLAASTAAGGEMLGRESIWGSISPTRAVDQSISSHLGSGEDQQAKIA